MNQRPQAEIQQTLVQRQGSRRLLSLAVAGGPGQIHPFHAQGVSHLAHVARMILPPGGAIGDEVMEDVVMEDHDPWVAAHHPVETFVVAAVSHVIKGGVILPAALRIRRQRVEREIVGCFQVHRCRVGGKKVNGDTPGQVGK